MCRGWCEWRGGWMEGVESVEEGGARVGWMW